MSYEASLKHKRDAESVFNSAKKSGIEQGIETGLKQGIETGIKQGIERGAEAKSYEVVKNLINELKLTDDIIARVAEVSLDFVQKVRADLARDKK